MKNKHFKILFVISKLSLIIANLIICANMFAFIAFLNDLSQLEAGVKLWHSIISKIYLTAIISTIGIALGFIAKGSHIKKIFAFTAIGYLLSDISANIEYHRHIDFPLQIIVAFISVLPFIASISYTMDMKHSQE